MGNSILVFASHSSEDKQSYIEPIVEDLESCFINVWIDKRKILPGDNLRKSIFREGLDKADVALIFFTEKSLKSSWVDREIKHVLREETKKGNQFDLSKIISVFESQSTYDEVADRYPELTDDLLHLMPVSYDKIQLGQLVSAIWSKYLDLQGGDVETQRQLLEKDREIFQKDKEKAELEAKLEAIKSKTNLGGKDEEFERIYKSGQLTRFIQERNALLSASAVPNPQLYDGAAAVAFGFAEIDIDGYISVTIEGKEFLGWCILNEAGTNKTLGTNP